MPMPDSTIDVLIIGAGPSGLAAALWLAQLDVPFRIIDKREDQPRVGQADGLNPKTMEIFERFEIHDQVTKLWEPATDETLWYRDDNGQLRRIERYRNVPPPGVRWTHGTLQQGRVEEIMKKRVFELSGVAVEYHTCLVNLTVDTSQLDIPEAHPCTVLVERPQGQNEQIHARYVIGADGGKSQTRQLLGFDMQGNKGSSIWGVMDFSGGSNFPDFGTTSIIRNDIDGSVDFVRREEDLVRMYVELNKGPEGEHITRDVITPELIIKKCQYLLRPFKLDVRHWVWWSAFTATQRLSSALSAHQRVFLVGDAVHTHSPVTGMGMNTSIQDSYNLGWKLAGVIKGQLTPRILKTYSTERGPVAHQLLEADRTALELFSTPFGNETPALLQRMEQMRIFLGGRRIRYDDPLLTWLPVQEMGIFKPGECLPEMLVTNHATGRSVSLHNVLQTNGSWCLIVFGGDVSHGGQMQRVQIIGSQLKVLQEKCRGSGRSFLNTVFVHCAPWTAVELADFPAIFFPPHEETGRDYRKIFIDEGTMYDEAGVDRSSGGLVLVRPDQHIVWIAGLDDFKGLERNLSHVFQIGLDG
ncbi:conserved hypothetical protein [Uncinocarpus reesii 1704]|uniref:FAD-binding domain-containing protein n=1 Tax=Uncinocarpus reesii (strain UAMH 1704) TaxID=336963 RepID=C4JN14_UNCRE|nr:uncharacterized protein UREG_04222 [Uncinocarpus reesii 1704]EEP79376.1 conserved hypothetical protein [Uncinocarpus reesii 1704]